MTSPDTGAADGHAADLVWDTSSRADVARLVPRPVIVATRHQPTEIKWVNNLGSADTTNVLAYKYSTDQTLHWPTR